MSDTPWTDARVAVHDEADPSVERTAGYNDLLAWGKEQEHELATLKSENAQLKSKLEQARERLITVHDKLCAGGHTLTYCVDVIMQIRDFLEEKE